MLIDTHLHLIDKNALSYPWLESAPALNRDFLFDSYRLQAERAGIGGALHIEVDVAPHAMQAETDHIRQIARRSGGFIKGAIASCRPEEPGFAAYLERQLSDPFVKGLRRVLHVVPDEVSEGALFRENIKRLEGTGLTFDLCVQPHQIGKAIALADLAPDLCFIVDHCGAPDIKAGALDGWREGMAEISRRPNVIAKISGLVVYCDAESWTVETLRPYAEQVIQSFGGTASYGAATGLSAHLPVHPTQGFRHGWRPPMPCLKDAAPRKNRAFFAKMRAASGIYEKQARKGRLRHGTGRQGASDGKLYLAACGFQQGPDVIGKGIPHFDPVMIRIPFEQNDLRMVEDSARRPRC